MVFSFAAVVWGTERLQRHSLSQSPQNENAAKETTPVVLTVVSPVKAPLFLPCSTPAPRVSFSQFQSPLQNHATQIKMADCGGFGNIDFLVKASGLSDPGLRLVIGLLSGNPNFITVAFEDFDKID